MRIALLANNVQGHNGWSRYARDLGNALKAAGHEILLVTGDTFPIHANPVVYLEHPWLATFHGWRLRALLKRWKPDVIHATAEPYALLLPSLRDWARASCVTMHGTYAVLPFEGKPNLKRRMEAAYEAADRVFSVSAFTKNFVKQRHPRVYDALGFEEKIQVLPNAIDLSDIPAPATRSKTTGPRRIIGVGAVKDRKGFLEAVDACAVLRKKGTVDFRYDIVGPMEDSGYAARLRERIARHGLQDRVQLRGEVPDEELGRLYAQADAFLLLSLQKDAYVEGFGLVFLEANARGLPVVGPDTGGCPEAISDGVSGFVVPPADAETAAQRLEAILLHDAIDPARCRKWAEEHDANRMAARMATMYEQSMRQR